MAGKKKKSEELKLNIYIVNDKTHKMMENTLLNIEQVEKDILEYKTNGMEIPDDVFMIHDILLSDMNILLKYRQQTGNDNIK